MGLANKIILRYCNYMCTTFEETAKKNKKCVYFERNKQVVGGKFALKFYSMYFMKGYILLFCNDLFFHSASLLVIGGSLGGKFINEKVWKNLDKLTEKFNVVHVTGKQAVCNNSIILSHASKFCIFFIFLM